MSTGMMFVVSALALIGLFYLGLPVKARVVGAILVVFAFMAMWWR